ncbi:hypothetical protein NV379_20595 [Paenibacillus sp. N1-5-1-14]|uniref:hypothetical protein n=1 Tax=Paenibacillus radicibacter TaxID=2972488 RepID=UPI0021598D4C|nr:hypothetical protein [Paenibacillus radicibacter]MCR8645058.1 hypothetical protein [Paenibacillus radicibacter]
MKKYIATLALVSSLSFVSTANANAPVPGSVDDPMITKSYFDQNVQKAVKDEVTKALAGGGGNNTAGDSTSTGGGSTELKVVQLKAGQTLLAKAGAEVIVRRGKLVAVSTDGESIPDVTSGKDLNPGAPVELNHLLVFPRDGRGVKPDAKNTGDIFIMVRGGYTIK